MIIDNYFIFFKFIYTIVLFIFGRKKYRVRNVRSLTKYDYFGVGLGYGMIKMLGPSSTFAKKSFFSVPKSSIFEYYSLGDRLNKKLFFHIFTQRTFFIKTNFSFRLRVSRPIKRARKLSLFIVYLRMLASYFKDIGLRALFKFFSCASRRKGAYQDNLISLFECRLVSIMYRLYFFYDLIDSFKFLKVNPIWSLNMNSYLMHSHFLVNVHDLLCFSPFIKGGLYWLICRKFLRNSVVGSIPKFIVFSWIFFKFFLKRVPDKKDLISTFPFDFFNFCGK